MDISVPLLTCLNTRHHFLKITDNDYLAMSEYHWPGNIRELKNILERASLLATDKTIMPAQFLANDALPATPSFNSTSEQIQPSRCTVCSLKEMEKQHINRTLQALNYNRSKTAISLDISRSTLIRKLKQYGLS
jgi:transcriptional regulator with PAS, ATPase and Fis domain